MADFYGTSGGFDTYAAASGRAVPTPVSPDSVDGALFRASSSLDAMYGSRFSGYKTGGRSQLRAFPRTDMYDAEGEEIGVDEIPIEVEYATYELAFQELTLPGSTSPVVTPGKTIKKVSVEGAVSVEYANTSAADQKAIVSSIEGILAPLFSSTVDYSGGLFGTAHRI
jgi:hypothetical protein